MQWSRQVMSKVKGMALKEDSFVTALCIQLSFLPIGMLCFNLSLLKLRHQQYSIFTTQLQSAKSEHSMMLPNNHIWEGDSYSGQSHMSTTQHKSMFHVYREVG